jgi:integrase/recombinase XerD
VPSIAGWELTGLPRAISAADVGRLLGSCDRGRPAGRRDFAILTVLARLGLRAGEVAALRLGDIDWRAGELTVHGKAGRQDRLPLTQEVGAAIAGWLQDGRPRCASAAVFTRVLAPIVACRTGPSRGWCARPASGRACPRWAPTGCATRSRRRRSGPAAALASRPEAMPGVSRGRAAGTGPER